MFPVVIPVAGLGTRSLPASKAIPKEMLPIYDRPIIQYIVEEAAASGSKEVIFVTSKGKSALENHFDKDLEIEAILVRRQKTELLQKVRELSNLVSVQSVRQKEALGLGHAVLQAKSMISASHFFVMLGDEMTDSRPSSLDQLLSFSKGLRSDAGVIAVMRVADADVSKYGICELDEKTGRILRCIEKPKPTETNSRWAITGRYLLPKDTFAKLETIKPLGSQEIQLTEALEILAKEQRLFALEYKGLRFDAGDRLGFLRANLHYYLQSSDAAATREILKEFLSQ